MSGDSHLTSDSSGNEKQAVPPEAIPPWASAMQDSILSKLQKATDEIGENFRSLGTHLGQEAAKEALFQTALEKRDEAMLLLVEEVQEKTVEGLRWTLRGVVVTVVLGATSLGLGILTYVHP